MPIDSVADISPIAGPYEALAAQTEFDYGFPIFAEEDLRVYVDDVLKDLDTDYTVTGEGEDEGGTVTFLSAMSGGEVVVIYRDTAIERLTDFQTNGPMASASFNDELDKHTVILQELRRDIGRAIRLPLEADVASADIELRPLANWVEKYVFIGADGTPEPATAVDTTTLSQSVIAALMFPQTSAESGAGVTPSNYAYPPGNVLRYGAVGDGVADDTAAVKRGRDVAMGTAGGSLYFPRGSYITDDTALQDLDRVTLYGDGCGDNIQAGATRLLLKTGTRTSLISTASNARRVSVRDLDLHGQGNATDGVTGFFNNASRHCDLERVFIKGFNGSVGTRGRGIRIHSGTSGTAGYFSRHANVLVHSCGIGIEATVTDGTNQPSLNTFIDVDIVACDDDGVKICDQTYGWQFIGGQSSNNGGDGYDFDGHSHIFIGCVPENNGGAGFRNRKSAANYTIIPGHYMQGASNVAGDFVDCAPGIYALTNQEITPAALANGNNNNYDVGRKQNGLLRLAGDAGGGSTLTGLGYRQDGQRITIINISTNPIFIDNQSSNSTEVNRIITPGGLQIRLAQNDIAVLAYDGTTDRWRVLSVVITGAQTYAAANVVTDRAFDANEAAGSISASPTQAEVENIRDAVLELADVVGTLIADLRARGTVL